MVQKVETYRDIKEALKRLNGNELDQPIKVTDVDGNVLNVIKISITEDDVYKHTTMTLDESMGTLVELASKVEDFRIHDCELLISKGSVILSAE